MLGSRWDELPPKVRREILVLAFVPPLSSILLGVPILLLLFREPSGSLAMAFFIWLGGSFVMTFYFVLRLLDDFERLPIRRTPEDLRRERRQM